MSDHLVLDFPVLQQDSADFVESVAYEFEAEQKDGKVTITHTLKGQSFIRQSIENKEAKFSVLLLYRDSAEREHHFCEFDEIEIKDSEIIAKQTINLSFSYAPEITPSIVILKNKTIAADALSGLNDFWKGEEFTIPEYSRIALHSKYKFTSGELLHLIKIELSSKLEDGEMKVEVNEYAGEGETPVTLECGKGVYDELSKIGPAQPDDPLKAMRSAIVTQALCAVYAKMNKIHKTREDYQESGVLLAHLEKLEQEAETGWADVDFNPSLAATKMCPYAIEALKSGENND